MPSAARRACSSLFAASGSPDADLRRFLDGAGGNPFLALDLLQALAADGAVRVDGGVATLIDSEVPDRVRATVRDRLGTLL